MEKIKSFLFRDWLGPKGYIQDIASLPTGEQIPRTTDKTVIIPYNYQLKEFDVFQYSKTQTDNKISIADIRELLEPLEKDLRETFVGVRPFTIPDWFLFLMVTFGYEIVMIISIAMIFESNLLRVVFIILFTLLLLPISHVLLKYIGQDALKRVKKQSLDHINKITNQQKFQSKGFQWRIPENFPTWIELNRTGAFRDTSAKLTQSGYSQISAHRALNLGSDELSSQPLLPNALPGGQVNYT